MVSKFRQQNYFYYLLAGIFLAHVLILFTKIQTDFSAVKFSPDDIIKIRLIQEVVKEKTLLNKRQIVQSEDSETKSKPINKAFLSDKDRSFEKETMSKMVDTFNKTAKGNSLITQKMDTGIISKKKTDFKNIQLSDVGVESSAYKPVESSRSPASKSIKGLENGDTLGHGLSSTNDYVEEVALGDFTHLNTVEYKFYGFFHRIRQKLEQFWGKSIQEKSEALFKAGRRLPASENLTTSLQVTLNEKGEITKVKVLGASGVRELDDAAVESFNQAGPFPNPPKELLVGGEATIEWGFVVKS